MSDTHVLAGLERRREDYPLITGAAHCVDDLRPRQGRPAALHMAVVRSPYAHAKIQSIQLEAARAVPGVVVAFAADELVQTLPDIEPMAVVRNLKKPPRKPLAVGRARYVGDPVAVVVAENAYAAQAPQAGQGVGNDRKKARTGTHQGPEPPAIFNTLKDAQEGGTSVFA
jgi:carbon-monoxide dehydrogenase large subunit